VTLRATAPRAGLSLLEVLVALAIFLMAVGALGQLVTQGGDNARYVSWLAQGNLIAQSRLAEAAAGSIPLQSQGDSPCDEDSDFNWAMDAEAQTAAGLYRVTVTVSRQQPNGDRFETKLSMFVLDPTVRGNTDGSSTGTDDAATTTGTTGTSGTTGGK